MLFLTTRKPLSMSSLCMSNFSICLKMPGCLEKSDLPFASFLRIMTVCQRQGILFFLTLFNFLYLFFYYKLTLFSLWYRVSDRTPPRGEILSISVKFRLILSRSLRFKYYFSFWKRITFLIKISHRFQCFNKCADINLLSFLSLQTTEFFRSSIFADHNFFYKP